MMINVVVYSVQPVLVTGLQSVLAPVNDLKLCGICPATDLLIQQLREQRPDLLLLELTGDITLDLLSAIRVAAHRTALILWVDDIATEFASKAIRLGVRGILRKSLPVELQIKCLQKVAAGELWVEKALSDKLLCARRVVLSMRERQVVDLLVQGLKNKELAHSLGITEGTVKVYLSRLFQKVGVQDRLELALYAMDNLYAGQLSDSSAVKTGPKDPAVHAENTRSVAPASGPAVVLRHAS